MSWLNKTKESLKKQVKSSFEDYKKQRKEEAEFKKKIQKANKRTYIAAAEKIKQKQKIKQLKERYENKSSGFNFDLKEKGSKWDF